jgi:hypothetical protein
MTMQLAKAKVESSKPETHQFQHATVVIKNNFSLATNRHMYKLYIQVIDQYRYQREFVLEYRHRSGNSHNCYWSCVAYRHPGRRTEFELSSGVAKRLQQRLEHIIREYPSLLFNDSGNNGRARHEGFVHFTECLLDGAQPSCKLL